MKRKCSWTWQKSCNQMEVSYKVERIIPAQGVLALCGTPYLILLHVSKTGNSDPPSLCVGHSHPCRTVTCHPGVCRAPVQQLREVLPYKEVAEICSPWLLEVLCFQTSQSPLSRKDQKTGCLAALILAATTSIQSGRDEHCSPADTSKPKLILLTRAQFWSICI